jgi:mono/diheme cytochrome c family protein
VSVRRERVGGVELGDAALGSGWLWVGAAGIVLALGMWLWHDISDPPGSLDRYLADRAAALDTGALLSEEMLHELSRDPLAVAAGANAYAEHCARCHGAGGEGDVAPNLVDTAWIKASPALDIYTTVVEGRTSQGMPPWGSLGRGTCMQITAYLLTLREADAERDLP